MAETGEEHDVGVLGIEMVRLDKSLICYIVVMGNCSL